MKQQGLPKNEHLKRAVIIQRLFQQGHPLRQYPLWLKWKIETRPTVKPVQVLFVASKKRYPTAVARHRIVRILREAYRKNKSIITKKVAQNEQQIAISITYTGPFPVDSQDTENKIILLLQRLEKEYESSQESY
jgi:ribonuclease P protein component